MSKKLRLIREWIFNDKHFFNIRKRKKFISFNDLSMFVGLRGTGKTYSTKQEVVRDALEDYLKSGDINAIRKFVWIRKSFEVIKQGLSSWTADIQLKDGYNIEANKTGIFLRKETEHTNRKGDVHVTNKMIGQIGFWAYLSTPQNFKSIVYDGVQFIVLDEFIDEMGSYRTNEVQALMSIISTVFRHRMGTIILLANNINKNNPYFSFFGIGEDDIPEWHHAKTWQRGKLKIGLEMVGYSPKLEKEYQVSTVGKVMDDTEYGNYAMKGEWLQDNSFMVMSTPKERLETKWNVKLLSQNYEILKYGKNGYYIRKGKNKGSDKLIYLTLMDADSEGKGFTYSDPQWLVNVLRSAGDRSNLWFKDGDDKDNFIAWLNKYK